MTRTWRMGETSKLVALYTEDLGKVRVIAKGARKPISKFVGALELFSEVQGVFYYREDRDLHTLSECDLLRSFPSLPGSLDRVSFASAACELVDRLTIEHQSNRPLYGYLIGALRALGEIEITQAESLFWYFQLRLAEALGYRPELTHCISCGVPLEAARLWFSAALGGGLCDSCGPDKGRAVAGESLRFARGLQALEAYSREALPPTPKPAGEIRQLLNGFLEYHTGGLGRLKSLDFLDATRSRNQPT